MFKAPDRRCATRKEREKDSGRGTGSPLNEKRKKTMLGGSFLETFRWETQRVTSGRGIMGGTPWGGTRIEGSLTQTYSKKAEGRSGVNCAIMRRTEDQEASARASGEAEGDVLCCLVYGLLGGYGSGGGWGGFVGGMGEVVLVGFVGRVTATHIAKSLPTTSPPQTSY